MLACRCLTTFWCEIGCPEGTAISPVSSCGSCTSIAEIKKLFPAWATDADIAMSGDFPDGLVPFELRYCKLPQYAPSDFDPS